MHTLAELIAIVAKIDSDVDAKLASLTAAAAAKDAQIADLTAQLAAFQDSAAVVDAAVTSLLATDAKLV